MVHASFILMHDAKKHLETRRRIHEDILSSWDNIDPEEFLNRGI